MSYYSNKKKYDPNGAGNSKEGSPKHINDPYYGTGSSPANRPVEKKVRKTGAEVPPTIHKDYDASKNSGGSHSSDIAYED
jgi:hypothetical protein